MGHQKASSWFTCIPSTPLIPTPTCASWIIPTSFAPSPIPSVIWPVLLFTSLVIWNQYLQRPEFHMSANFYKKLALLVIIVQKIYLKKNVHQNLTDFTAHIVWSPISYRDNTNCHNIFKARHIPAVYMYIASCLGSWRSFQGRNFYPSKLRLVSA